MVDGNPILPEVTVIVEVIIWVVLEHWWYPLLIRVYNQEPDTTLTVEIESNEENHLKQFQILYYVKLSLITSLRSSLRLSLAIILDNLVTLTSFSILKIERAAVW